MNKILAVAIMLAFVVGCNRRQHVKPPESQQQMSMDKGIDKVRVQSLLGIPQKADANQWTYGTRHVFCVVFDDEGLVTDFYNAKKRCRRQ